MTARISWQRPQTSHAKSILESRQEDSRRLKLLSEGTPGVEQKALLRGFNLRSVPLNVDHRITHLPGPGVHNFSNIDVPGALRFGLLGEGCPEVTCLGIAIGVLGEVEAEALLKGGLAKERLQHAYDGSTLEAYKPSYCNIACFVRQGVRNHLLVGDAVKDFIDFCWVVYWNINGVGALQGITVHAKDHSII